MPSTLNEIKNDLETPADPSRKRSFSIIAIASIMFIFMILVAYFIYIALPNKGNLSNEPGSEAGFKYSKFSSEEEFRNYWENQPATSNFFGGFGMGSPRDMAFQELSSPVMAPNAIGAEMIKDDINRVSETNVQVKGIDEPDIVKTDGKNIYFSSQNYSVYGDVIVEPIPLLEKPLMTDESSVESILPPDDTRYYGPKINVIESFPPTNLKSLTTLSDGGEMLLLDQTLAVINGNKITGYNISNPASPANIWNYELEDNSYIQTSRLYNNDLYIVTNIYVSDYINCPIPLYKGINSVSIPCTDIYRPSFNVPVDTTYTVTKIDFKTGAIKDTVSFVGSTSTSVIYMSPDSIYATFSMYKDTLSFINEFLATEASDLFPKSLLDNLKKVSGYDISEQSKLNEFEIIFFKYLNSQKGDERARIENELTNRMTDYMKLHSRDFEKTGIVKIKNDNLEIAALGEVPGSPLNQFALDEYQSNLRIATTTSGSSRFGSGTSSNDVYILDSGLNRLGSVIDMGLTERVYAVRFIEDKGYVVTFRQTDPFYVLNLANPSAPKIDGELKIPGFSSYLHPITKDLIIGVGQENSNSKISLFDSSNPSNPIETDKYALNEYWSEVQNNHHAFLLDASHKIFFIPGGASGYIFGYEGNKLELKRVVANIQARRAIYINDYLYVLGDQKIVVVDENTWKDVNELNL